MPLETVADVDAKLESVERVYYVGLAENKERFLATNTALRKTKNNMRKKLQRLRDVYVAEERAAKAQ